MLLLDPSATDAARAQIVAQAQASIEADGTLVTQQEWGLRALAYPIEHREQAEYHLLQFHGPPALLASLDRTLHVTDGVVRHRIVKLAPGTPPPKAMPDERPAPPSATVAPNGAAAESVEPDAGGEPLAAADPAMEAAPAAEAEPGAEAETAPDAPA